MAYSTTRLSTKLVAYKLNSAEAQMATTTIIIPRSTRPELVFRTIQSSLYMTIDRIAISTRSDRRMV